MENVIVVGMLLLSVVNMIGRYISQGIVTCFCAFLVIGQFISPYMYCWKNNRLSVFFNSYISVLVCPTAVGGNQQTNVL